MTRSVTIAGSAEQTNAMTIEHHVRQCGRSATVLLIAMAAVFVAVSQVEYPGFWSLLSAPVAQPRWSAAD